MDKTLSEKISFLHQRNDIGIYYCGKRENTKNHIYGPEIRDHYLFVLVKKGSAVLYSNDDLIFGDHDLLVMFPRSRVHYRALTDWSISWIGLYGQTVDDMINKLGITRNKPIEHINLYDEIRQIFSDIYNLSSEPSSFENDLEITKLLYEFFKYLFLNRKINRSIDPVEAAVKIMDLNYNAALSVEDIAKKLSVNSVYFSRIFKMRIGISPKSYIIKKRIERAKYLLENTNSAISEISNSVGYEDSLYFSRIFKKSVGLSPGKYRVQFAKKYTDEVETL